MQSVGQMRLNGSNRNTSAGKKKKKRNAMRLFQSKFVSQDTSINLLRGDRPRFCRNCELSDGVVF